MEGENKQIGETKEDFRNVRLGAKWGRDSITRERKGGRKEGVIGGRKEEQNRKKIIKA